MRIRIFISLCFVFFALRTFATPEIKYIVSFEEPRTHYVKVQMEISNWSKQELEVKMPVWTPGSYLVREFSRFVERLKAYDKDNVQLHAEKFSKNGWRINAGRKNKIYIEYFVYAYELSVRTSFIDEEHAFINGAGVFMFINNALDLPCTVEIKPNKAWKSISTSLDRQNPDNPWIFKVEDYDHLIDAPMEIGNHYILRFEAAGIPHEMALFGQANYDTAQIKIDVPKIVEEEKKIFGELPCKKYVFIVHNIPNGSGGLEHMNSTTLQVGRNGYTPGGSYNNFLSLVAHEYFHLWNVKRLRPKPLGPFNYDQENYTDLLYIAEGFTAYYASLISRRCNFITEDGFLSAVAGFMTTLDNTPGNYIQSLAESGIDAWIKYYRPSENNINATISYYTKGALIGALLDIYLLDATAGKRGLDEVMKQLYDEFYKNRNKGYTAEDFIKTVEKIAGHDMNSFFGKYIYRPDTIPYKEFFNKAGLILVDDNLGKSIPYLGANSSFINGKINVTAVERNSPAWRDGINVNDELLAADDVRLTDDLTKFIATKKANDEILFTVSRSGILKTVKVKLVNTPKVSYSFKKSDQLSVKENLIYQRWLNE